MPSRLKVKVWKAQALPPDWVDRIRATEAKDSDAFETAETVINRVKTQGDAGLRDLTKTYDKIPLPTKKLTVTLEEIQAAYKELPEEQITAIRMIKEKLEFREKLTLQLLQKPKKTSREGISVQTSWRPIESVGCYVPGGRAAYPSTVVMTATPAKVAGVPRIVVCSPPNSKKTVNPLILVAADICGVNEVYKVGGAQAIAALAYGTKTIKPVKKIVGPGSRYVTAAKILVSKKVAIDMPAGPSEILVLADETANPKLIAADMISQAEHGADSVSGLITTSKQLAYEVLSCLRTMASTAERETIVTSALSTYGFIITCENMNEMISLANAFAPEHLEIMARNPKEIADKITSAGLILIGQYSPVALSDYGSGTNHVLPTGGFAKSFSGLSAFDFMRRVSIVESTREGLLKVKDNVMVLTDAERLPNHYKAVEARFEE